MAATSDRYNCEERDENIYDKCIHSNEVKFVINMKVLPNLSKNET